MVLWSTWSQTNCILNQTNLYFVWWIYHFYAEQFMYVLYLVIFIYILLLLIFLLFKLSACLNNFTKRPLLKTDLIFFRFSLKWEAVLNFFIGFGGSHVATCKESHEIQKCRGRTVLQLALIELQRDIRYRNRLEFCINFSRFFYKKSKSASMSAWYVCCCFIYVVTYIEILQSICFISSINNTLVAKKHYN